MGITEQQMNRVKSEWSKIAEENLDIEFINGAFYAFGSELATLRLLKSFRHKGDDIESDYSEHLQKFFFRLETSL